LLADVALDPQAIPADPPPTLKLFGGPLPDISYGAKFNPADAPARILKDLACPVCGHQDPGNAHRSIADNKLRIFCDHCGAFITISLSHEQARALHRCSAILSELSERAP
jgi:hypothetical protein